MTTWAIKDKPVCNTTFPSSSSHVAPSPPCLCSNFHPDTCCTVSQSQMAAVFPSRSGILSIIRFCLSPLFNLAEVDSSLKVLQILKLQDCKKEDDRKQGGREMGMTCNWWHCGWCCLSPWALGTPVKNNYIFCKSGHVAFTLIFPKKKKKKNPVLCQ